MSDQQQTEQKIKETARILFMKKGFAGTKTREIAEEAGINLALLNYYFRSKEKLFHEIMMESLAMFFQHVMEVFMNTDTSLEEKFEKVAEEYINQILKQPDIPLFILSELRTRPDEFVSQVSRGAKLQDFVLFKQLVEKMGEDRAARIDPIHIMMNLMSLTIFPFVGKPMLRGLGNIQDDRFDELMEERKRLIPMWVSQMLV